MYRVGFGDCFLLSLPASGETQHVLVDCGVHARGDIGTLERVVGDIAEQTGRSLALVIATHAHQDHISGFAAHEEVFRGFQVREVWLPWTENPRDPVAVRLKQKQAALAETVFQQLAARPPSGDTRLAVEAAIENLTGKKLSGESLTSNEQALRVLKSGINGAEVVYVKFGKQFDDAAGIKGLSARILGPPRDEEYLARMDPPPDERFLRAADGGGLEPVNAIVPFENKWKVEASSNRYYGELDERDKNLLAVAATDAEGLVFTLDRIVNNTSVVAVFMYRGKYLLFPGDAQYGSWEGWIRRPETSGLLADVNFYKVAHHGSYNATPVSALEGMTEKSFAAMVSTQSEPWASIPLAKLMQALGAKSEGIVRSDSISIEGAPEGPVLSELPTGFETGPFWFDYLLPV